METPSCVKLCWLAVLSSPTKAGPFCILVVSQGSVPWCHFPFRLLCKRGKGIFDISSQGNVSMALCFWKGREKTLGEKNRCWNRRTGLCLRICHNLEGGGCWIAASPKSASGLCRGNPPRKEGPGRWCKFFSMIVSTVWTKTPHGVFFVKQMLKMLKLPVKYS